MPENKYKQLQEKLGKKLKTDESLAKYTTYKIGGSAEYFYNAETLEEAQKVLETAKELDIDYVVIGHGSNILINSDGVDDLVIRLDNDEVFIEGDTVIAGAGVVLDDLVDMTLKKGLTGLEWAGGLPSSVGGAVYGNAGAYRKDTSMNVTKVKSFNGKKIVEYKNAEIGFDYRHSIFKKEKKGEIILSVEFKLEKGDMEKAKKEANDHREDRKKKHPLEYGSAGCIFKNVKLKPGKLELLNFSQGRIKGSLQNDCPPEYIERGVIPASYLIELADLKGYKIGNVQVSPKHANFLVNLGDAKSEHVIMLISYIKQHVRDQFGIRLMQEIQLIGY